MTLSDVVLPEAYTLPFAALALTVGILEARQRPDLSSWAAYGPALLAAFVPTIGIVLATDGGELREVLLLLGAVTTLIIGSRLQQQAPVVVGARRPRSRRSTSPRRWSGRGWSWYRWAWCCSSSAPRTRTAAAPRNACAAPWSGCADACSSDGGAVGISRAVSSRSAASFSATSFSSPLWKSVIFRRSAGSDAPRIRTASSPALRAPPIDTVATGTPAGICTIESSESMPSRYFSGTGTPITGSGVSAATMPGRWAAPPAPVMITCRPRSAADDA